MASASQHRSIGALHENFRVAATGVRRLVENRPLTLKAPHCGGSARRNWRLRSIFSVEVCAKSSYEKVAAFKEIAARLKRC